MSNNATTSTNQQTTDQQPTDQQAAAGNASTADRLRSALAAHPGSTTEQLAAHAHVGQSTAGKLLARWVSDATVARHTTNGTGKGRPPSTFTLTEPTIPNPNANPNATGAHANSDRPDTDAVATDTTDVSDPTPPDLSPDDPTPDDEGSVGAVARLAPGGLRGMVEDYLRDHPTDDLGPATIGKELRRSSGAVANALDRLVKDGYALMTSPKPKRYRLAPSARPGD